MQRLINIHTHRQRFFSSLSTRRTLLFLPDSKSRSFSLPWIRTVHMPPREPTRTQAQQRTIYALSTPPGKAGVAVIRVSGPQAIDVWKNLVIPARGKGKGKAKANDNFESVPSPWKMERCHIVHPRTKEHLDDALAVYFKGPRSFTTEDVLELHIHSGRAIIASVLAALADLPGCRPAEPGEFTRRAFLGGRLDLTQVEGLKDLIDADTEGQRRSAMRVAGGAVREKLAELRSRIIHCLAMVEALIDFEEGDDIEEGVYETARIEAQSLLSTIRSFLNDNRRGEIIHSGIKLAIFGPPNAGKSSLLNFLAQREAAIVTPIPGTTRDILELTLDISGLPVRVSDTAGLRGTEDIVEKIGVERAREAVKQADVTLCVLSLPSVIDSSIVTKSQVHPLNIAIPESLAEVIRPDTLFLLNKVDLVSSNSAHPISVRLDNGCEHQAWTTSLTTHAGTDDFLKGLGEVMNTRFGLGEGLGAPEPIITRARHRVHVESAARFLEAFLDYTSADIVLGAEELRYAAQAVGRVSGLIDVEEVLDAVFRDFCIGK